MIPEIRAGHIKILMHLSTFKLPEDRPMPYSTTADGIGERIGLEQCNVYPKLTLLEAAGLVEVRSAPIIGAPRGKCSKPTRSYVITARGRTLAHAFRQVWPGELERITAPAEAPQHVQRRLEEAMPCSV